MLTLLVRCPDEDALQLLADDPAFADAAERAGATILLIDDRTVRTFPSDHERG